MKNNNAGFSLVEVIIAVAMLTILTGVGAYGIGQVTGFRAREAADKITSSITENKIETLGKAKASGASGGMAWELYEEDGDFYVRTVYDIGLTTEHTSDAEKVNDGKVIIWVGNRQPGGSASHKLSAGEVYRIYFNRSTGAVCTAVGDTYVYNPYIQVSYGRKTYEIEVISKTGKVISNSRK